MRTLRHVIGVLHVLQKDSEGIRSTGSILLNPPVRDWDAGIRSQMDQVNYWLHGQDFLFYVLECTFKNLGILTWYGTQLNRWGNSILGSRLSGLTSRTLNEIQLERGSVLGIDRMICQSVFTGTLTLQESAGINLWIVPKELGKIRVL